MKYSFGGLLTLPALALACWAGIAGTPWRSVFPIAIPWLRFIPRPQTVVDQMLTDRAGPAR